MVTCYNKDYADKNDIIDKSFFDSKDPMAKQNRDKEARSLRKDGYSVKTSVCHFDTTTVYYFHAVKAYTVI